MGDMCARSMSPMLARRLATSGCGKGARRAGQRNFVNGPAVRSRRRRRRRPATPDREKRGYPPSPLLRPIPPPPFFFPQPSFPTAHIHAHTLSSLPTGRVRTRQSAPTRADTCSAAAHPHAHTAPQPRDPAGSVRRIPCHTRTRARIHTWQGGREKGRASGASAPWPILVVCVCVCV